MKMINYEKIAERWAVFEISLTGPEEGNPFQNDTLTAVFEGTHERKTVNGFYDGNGIYRIRFMPSFTGEYSAVIRADFLREAEKICFSVTEAKESNHGPVRTSCTYHFSYEDGTPFYPVGTTCYVWHLQKDQQICQTLDTLLRSAFNKIRFCVMPKHYDYNLGEPRSYPYEGTPMDSSVLTKDNFNEYTGKTEGNHWDFTRFNPEYFQHLERCIASLQNLGIEADLILFHPYDRWGFSCMTMQEDLYYLKYVINRFSAYRNVWWSLANEYDILESKTQRDWEQIASFICEHDLYGHLRSIHNCHHFYDYSRPWVTHCSVQRIDLYRTAEIVNEMRDRYRKPVVLDEIAYEGNIQYGWGNITGEEMVRRFWEAACRGGYPGHGETFLDVSDLLWWSHGGILRGESHKRFRFLLDIMKETPSCGLHPYEKGQWDEVCAIPETEVGKSVKSYYLIYYSFMRPSFRDYYFDDDTEYEYRVLDTWNMTVESQGRVKGKFRIMLPGRQYMALQLKRVG